MQTKADFPTENLLEYEFFSLICLSFFQPFEKKYLEIQLEERIGNNRFHGSCLLQVSFSQGLCRLNRGFFLALEILAYMAMVPEERCLACVFTNLSTGLWSKEVEEMAGTAWVPLYDGKNRKAELLRVMETEKETVKLILAKLNIQNSLSDRIKIDWKFSSHLFPSGTINI